MPALPCHGVSPATHPPCLTRIPSLAAAPQPPTGGALGVEPLGVDVCHPHSRLLHERLRAAVQHRGLRLRGCGLLCGPWLAPALLLLLLLPLLLRRRLRGGC